MGAAGLSLPSGLYAGVCVLFRSIRGEAAAEGHWQRHLMRVSKNGGTPKWVVYSGNTIKIPLRWMMTGSIPPILGNISLFSYPAILAIIDHAKSY